MRKVLAAVIGYLLGTIPFADWVARLASKGQVDLREAGSGNPGGTNVAVTVGTGWGGAVMAADVGKGVAACLVSRAIAGTPHIGGPASVVGHCYPVWNGLRGGKGVACAGGQIWATFTQMAPVVGVTAFGTGRLLHSFGRGTGVAAAVWIAACVHRWRSGHDTAGLPAAAVASAAIVLHRFVVGARTRPIVVVAAE